MENFKKYEELPEDIKIKYKPINERGDYVRVTSIEDPETAHRWALLENEAFGALEESVKNGGLSVAEIIDKLSGKEIKWDEKSKLRDLLFQNADLQRLKGASIDEQLEEFLTKSYTSLKYSKVLTDKLVKGIEPGDTKVIGEALKDERINEDWDILRKLTNDEQRLAVFEICKERAHAAFAVAGSVEDLDMAVEMYSRAQESVDVESYSDKNEMETSGMKLANKLFEAGRKEQLLDLVKSGTLRLPYLKDFMHHFGSNPEFIIQLIKSSSNADDIYYPLKFVTDQKLLAQLLDDSDSFTRLNDEQRGQVVDFVQTINGALEAEPDIVILSEFIKDEPFEFDKDRMEAKNKFVVGIRNGKYVIAFSNMNQHEYHRNIFDSIGGASTKSGGYLGMEEKEGKVFIRLVRSSGDFGFYSKELLERSKGHIEESLKRALGGKEFELTIKTSSQYE